LNIVLRELYKTVAKESNKNKVVILSLVDEDPYDSIEEYKEVLKYLKQNRVIGSFKDGGRGGYIEDDITGPHDVYFYTPKCVLKPQELTKFLIKTSRLPKYSLRMGKDRKLILNDKYVISRPQFCSSNHYFIEYILAHPNETITKNDIEKTTKEKIDKRFHTALEQLNITSEIRNVFFPGVAIDVLEFRNDVKVKDLDPSYDKKMSKFLVKLQNNKS
jgi:hypothetical protein